jgi:hypothetical protein
MEARMNFETAIKIAEDPKFNTVEQLECAFDLLAEFRDRAQEGLARINHERQRRTAEEVKRLRAEIAAKA